ncbi:MAG: Rrf2 family transcriptional regulator [Candidatus Marinimicrobia bacterium]|nr:Rrf2 family transcriptional regulator [Candidatus Neomarinimicrobiota bacterium]MCF7904186.1 Rrf2 family transcriptional regulator [Candidatus Neomarinimicrobiota bacterium]
MTVLFSRKCEYALQGLLYLAKHRDSGPISADLIAGELGMSREFISKTLQSLVKEGVVISQRGKAGGFSLQKAPEKISLLDIVLIIDGDEVFQGCVLGLPACGSEEPCPVHDTWGPLREQTREMLATTSLASIESTQKLIGIEEHENA